MKKFGHFLLAILKWCWRNWKTTVILLLLAVIAYFGYGIYNAIKNGEPLMAFQHTEAIDETPEEVRAMRAIGQWEFLSVSTEELIEKHESHLVGDKHLVKVYKGTLRLGIDMQKAADDWCVVDGQTVNVTLPDITLLDNNFIDEARTVTFYEKGSFSAEEKQALYDQACAAMKKRSLSTANIATARQAAEEQFTRLFAALGYKNISVAIGPKPQSTKK